MARTIRVTPETIDQALEAVGAGDVVVLAPGRYRRRLTVRGATGTTEAPIIIRGEPGAVLDGGQRFEDFNPRAQVIAQGEDDNGCFPGLYSIAHEGILVLDECVWVNLESLEIEGAWPTAIFLNNSRHIVVESVRVRESTWAIAVHGERSRYITVQDCHWLQDITEGDLWSRVGWERVHGDHVKTGDARGYDGDFFRAYLIEGDVVIRRNLVEHAFNGVHMYNYKVNPRPDLNNNVQIYDNRFRYIRDNPIEPEYGATNWWVYHNELFNCHKWFSFQMKRSGYFYVFGNVGWFDDMPGPPEDDNAGGGVFKFQGRVDPAVAPHYVFNNSWYLRSSYIKKKRLSSFLHTNNAIAYCDPGTHGSDMCEAPKAFFGSGASIPPTDPIIEKKQFTTAWKKLGIAFVNDIVCHEHFPGVLREMGYPIEDGVAADPDFVDRLHGDLRLNQGSPCRGAGRPLRMTLPDGSHWETPETFDVGAYQGETLFEPHPFVRYEPSAGAPSA